MYEIHILTPNLIRILMGSWIPWSFLILKSILTPGHVILKNLVFVFIGVITELEEDSGLIDGQYYFSRSLTPKISLKPLQIGDNVQYKAVRKSENQQWTVSEIIMVKNDEWEAEKKGQTCTIWDFH